MPVCIFVGRAASPSSSFRARGTTLGFNRREQLLLTAVHSIKQITAHRRSERTIPLRSARDRNSRIVNTRDYSQARIYTRIARQHRVRRHLPDLTSARQTRGHLFWQSSKDYRISPAALTISRNTLCVYLHRATRSIATHTRCISLDIRRNIKQNSTWRADGGSCQ